MKIRFGSHKSIQFTDKTHPVMGILSLLIGLAALTGLITLFFLSSSVKGNSGMYAGVGGIFVLLASIVGFILAVRCYKKEDIYMTTPAVGSVLNGVLIVICLMLYVLGSV